MDIVRGLGIEAAARASGAVVVVDTFRAFTTAAVLVDRGVSALYLTADVDTARDLAASLGGIACGEDHGVTPAGFELGNSPAEARAHDGLGGRIVVQRTTAGTRSVVAALAAGASPVYAASLVVASATAEAVSGYSRVTIISAGLHGTDKAVEDDLTGDLIAGLLTGSGPGPAAIAHAVARSERAEALRSAPWAGPEDVAVATDVDSLGFAMRVSVTSRGLARLAPAGRT